MVPNEALFIRWVDEAGLKIFPPEEMPDCIRQYPERWQSKSYKPFEGARYVIGSPDAQWIVAEEKTKPAMIWGKQPKVLYRRYKPSKPVLAIGEYEQEIEICWRPEVHYRDEAKSIVTYNPKVKVASRDGADFLPGLEAVVLKYCAFSPIQVGTPEELILELQPVWEQSSGPLDPGYRLSTDDILCFKSEVGKSVIPGKDAMRLIKGQVGVR